MRTIINKETNTPIVFSPEDLPMLIHAQEGLGASLFSVAVAAQYVLSGAKLIFFTGFHMAKDELYEMIDDAADTFFIEDISQLPDALSKQVIIVKSGDESLLCEVIKNIPSVDDYVIFVKNIELYGKEVMDGVIGKENVIISGDIDKSEYVSLVAAKEYRTKILFSQPEADINVVVPALKKYEGVLVDDDSHATIGLS